MHLFDHTFDHDYYFELPRKGERDTQSIGLVRNRSSSLTDSRHLNEIFFDTL